MKDILFYLLVGVGAGALYGLLGAGIVVAYRGSGVINFAHGALAAFSVFTYTELRRDGDIILPWVDILPGDLNLPVKVSLGDEWGFWPAVLGMLAMSVFLGVLIHFLVFRPLRNASPLGKVIGSLGVLLYLQGVALVHYGTSGRQLQAVFPDDPWNNFLGMGRPFRQDAFWVAVAALAIGAGLWAVFKYTRFGVGTRAAAENEKGAVLLGYSPEFLALANWIIASVLAALAGLLVGQLAGALDPGRYTLFIVPALGAALIAGLSSVLLAVIGGLGLGMIQSFVGWWSTDADFFPDWASSGIRDAIPLLIIALVLFLRGKSLPIRGTVAERRLALSPRPVRVLPHALIWPAAVLVLASIVTGAWELAMTTSLITAILMLSYVVLTGYVGQISLAQLTLAGVSAFFMVRLMSDGTVSDTTPFPVDGPGWPMIVAMPLAVALAVIVGVLIGLPALRIRGVQLAVVTIAAGLAISSFYFNNPQLTDLEAGSDAPVPPPDLFGADLGIVGGNGLSDNFAFTAFCVVMVSLCAVAVANLRRATTGRRFLAVRANERAAAAAGVDVSRTKLLAFGISSALAGIAGCMFAFQFTAISSSNWEVFLGLAVLAFAYLGGITSVNGALVGGYLTGGGFSAVFGEYHFEGLDQYLPIMGGLGLVLTAIIHPEGIAPFFQPLLRHAGNAMIHNRWPEWRRFLVRVGPTALAGAIFGWVVWARQDHFNNWMILVGIGLFLFVRAIVLRILAARRGEGHVHPGAGHGPASSPASAPEAVLAQGTSAPVAAAGAGPMEVTR